MFIENWTEKINDVLRKSGMSEKEFCNKMGITSRHLTYLRKSDGKIEDKVYVKICEIFGIPLTYFSEEKNFITPPQDDGDRKFLPIYTDSLRTKTSIIKLQEEYVSRLSATPKRLFMAHVFDDSMSPLLPYNSDVVIEPEISFFLDGKTYYLELEGNKIFRKIVVDSGEIKSLIAIKDSVRTEISKTDNLRILGRAILVLNEI